MRAHEMEPKAQCSGRRRACTCYVQLRLSLTCWEVQSTVETVPMKAFSFTPHFSMFSPLLPSLEMLVTYGPAVVQPATEATKNRATANFFIPSPYFTWCVKHNALV